MLQIKKTTSKKVKYNVGATRHFDHSSMRCGKTPDESARHCQMCNQAWNRINQKHGRPLIELDRPIFGHTIIYESIKRY